MDGVSLSSGDRVLLKNQSTTSQNGIYTWAGSSTLLVRTPDADSASDFVYGFQIYVREGTANAATYWMYTQSSAVTLETTSLTFASTTITPTLFSDAEGNPANLAGTSSDGTSLFTARRDHVHQGFNDAEGDPANLTGSTASDGTSTYSARRDHAHKGFLDSEGDPVDVTGSAAADGTSAYTARRDHAHKLGITTTQGDLIVGGSSGVPQRLAAGSTAGQVLTSGGSGVIPTWAAPSGGGSGGGGGSGAISPIQVVGPLTATAGTIAFTQIPQTGYRNLRLVLRGRGTTSATQVRVDLQFNGDTGNNYDGIINQNNTTFSNLIESLGVGAMPIADIAAATSVSGDVGTLELWIPGYTDTTQNKDTHGNGTVRLAATTTNLRNIESTGHWRSTAAINSITLTPGTGSFDVGSYACLYGEMDTAGVLLTPASNQLYETTLTAAAASINTGTLSQAYRDLRVEIFARGDTAATSTAVTMRINGDSGANYNFEQIRANGAAAGGTSSTGQNSGNVLLNMPANTGTANVFANTSLRIDNYTAIVGFKTWVATGFDLISNLPQFDGYAGWWASQVAVTSLSFTPAAGNFAAGTTVRVYGEPLASGGSAVGTGTRLRLSGNQSITTATATAITWDTEDNDADQQHYESAASLTGTVAKTATSATLAGTSTAFLTELSVGQVIAVPGTATEKRVVIAIASNTSLTVNSGFVNSASGQTAARVNTAVVFRQPGFYMLETNIYSAALSTGAVTLQYYLNNLTTATSGTAIGQRDPVAINASAGYDLVVARSFQQWDFVEVVWTQNSGGNVNVLADERTHFAVNARPTIIVAVPYVCVKDVKTAFTHGGTFTSGSDQTRDLNTIDSDTAGIASLSGNQLTLPPGTYRYSISCPAYLVDYHQAVLYNVTDSAIVKRGTAELASSSTVIQTRSWVIGKMTISGTKVFEVRHRCATTSASTNGFGIAMNWSDIPTYTVAEFFKEG